MYRIGSRPPVPFVDVVAIPARQETGPPGGTVTQIIRHASRPGDQEWSPSHQLEIGMARIPAVASLWGTSLRAMPS
jgi:hypothetical protein